jgi:hypothetical protein
MVLQRDRPIHIWGWSDPGEKVAVAFHGTSRDTLGDRLGNWSVFLPPEAAGGPYQLTVTSSNKIVLDDVLIGDVWFASGQPNMEMPLKGFPGAPLKDSAEEIAHAGQPASLRFDCSTSPTRPRTSRFGTAPHPGLHALRRRPPTSRRRPTSSDVS